MRGWETTCYFKPTDMQDLDPDSWEEFLRQVIFDSFMASKYDEPLDLKYTLNSYKDHANHLLDLNMIYISEIRFYHGRPKCDSDWDHEYLIADIKTSPAEEDTVYTLFRRRTDSNDLHCHSPVESSWWEYYLPWFFESSKEAPKAECFRIKERDLQDKLIGRISLPRPESHNTCPSATPPLDQSLRLHELLVILSVIIDTHQNQWLCCHLFTAYTFHILSQLKSILVAEGNSFQSGPSAIFTDQMKRGDVLKNGVADEMECRLVQKVIVDVATFEEAFRISKGRLDSSNFPASVSSGAM